MKADSASEIMRQIRAYAETTPEAPAIIDDNGKKTVNYRDFVQMVDDIAYKLKSMGVTPGTVIPIRSGRCSEHIATRVAALSMGCVVLSLDMLIPDERAQSIIKSIGCRIVVDKDFFPVEHAPCKMEYPDFPENMPGFIIFTSGSTGAPKGILHPRATLTYFADLIEATRTEWEGHSLACIVSVSFVASMLEFLVTLRHGMPIYMIDDEMRADILAIRKFINDNKITHIACTTSYLRALGLDTTLEDIFVMGERAGSVDVGKYNVFNMYGSSEAIVSMRLLETVEDAPIGEAFDGTLDIIDEDGRPSDEGELVYRGRGIMLGYLNKIAGNIPSKPLEVYYTGDLARRDETGLHIIGRKGDMIKINGQRVEPAEVEYALSQIPGVSSAVVKAFFDNGTYMCGYYVSSEGLEPEKVRELLSQKVNPYMVPTFLARFESFPLLPNGKIDRMKLETLRPKPGKGEAPSNEVQAIVCDVFAKVLGEEYVTLDDVFMKVGGDSIKAIRAQSELSDMGVVITIDDILDEGTPRKIAEKVMSSTAQSAVVGTPVTPMQALMVSGKSRHGETVKITLSAIAPVDPSILQQAINAVTDRHTALRSSFAVKDGRLARSVSDRGTPVCIIGAFTKATPEHPLVCYPTDAQHLVFEIHRAVIDAHSIPIIFQEVAKVYFAIKMQKPVPAGFGSDFDYWWAGAVNYKSYAQKNEAEHWQNVLKSVEPCRTLGKIRRFQYGFPQAFPQANVFAAEPKEMVFAAILRAYSSVYGKKHVSAEITNTARNLAIGRASDVVGNLDSCYPAVFDMSEDGRIESDVFSALEVLRGVPRAGLGYGMAAFQTGTFVMPELSVEFADMDIPESPLLKLEGLDIGTSSEVAPGINITVAVTGGIVRILGAIADVPEIADKFDMFLAEIKNQSAAIVKRCAENLAAGRIEAPLTTLQLIRKNIIVGDKMPIDHTISVVDIDVDSEKAKEILRKLITFHPALKTRLADRNGVFWLEYSGEPEISVVPDQELSVNLLGDFVLDRFLSRFVIVDKGSKVTILADLHHQISDIASLSLLAEEIKAASKGKYPQKIDLGVVYAYWYEKQQKHISSPEVIADFYNKDLGGRMPISPLTDPENSDGKSGFVRSKLTVPRAKLAEFATQNGVSVGTVLTAAFGYVNSVFVNEEKISYFFLEHGRHSDESQDALGMYFRVLPMAVDCKDATAAEFLRLSMRNMVKSMALRYASGEDYLSWTKGDYVQFKYQTDMNERSGVDRLLDFMPPASYLSFMVGDLGKDFEIQLKYPPTASQIRSEKFVKAYDLAISGFLMNRRLSEIAQYIRDSVKL